MSLNAFELNEVVVQEDLVRITITSPVAATVAKQLEIIMPRIQEAAEAGKTDVLIRYEHFSYLHPKTVELLKKAGISASPRTSDLCFSW